MASSLTGKNNTKSYVGVQSKVKNIDPINELDRVNIYEFENGMDVELTSLGGELTSENIRKAQSKVLKNLKKDPAFYTNKIAEETIAKFGEFGSGKKKKGKYTTKKDAEGVKADVNVKETKEEKDKDNEMKELSKIEKSNVSKDKKSKNPNQVGKTKQETYTAKKAKGIKSTMDLPGKEKKLSLKEALDINDDKSVKASMSKFTDPNRKSMFGKVDPKHDRKVKLTKETMNMISEMVGKMVKEAQGTLSVGDLNKAKELSKQGVNVKYDDPKNPND